MEVAVPGAPVNDTAHFDRLIGDAFSRVLGPFDLYSCYVACTESGLRTIETRALLRTIVCHPVARCHRQSSGQVHDL